GRARPLRAGRACHQRQLAAGRRRGSPARPGRCPRPEARRAGSLGARTLPDGRPRRVSLVRGGGGVAGRPRRHRARTRRRARVRGHRRLRQRVDPRHARRAGAARTGGRPRFAVPGDLRPGPRGDALKTAAATLRRPTEAGSHVMRATSLACLFLSLAAALPAAAQAPATHPDLHQVMADPDWIGPPVEGAWWSWDGQHAYYELKRAGSSVRDVWRQPVSGGAPVRLDGASRATMDGEAPVYDATRSRMAFARNGDIFVRDLRTGTLQQLTRTDEAESRPQWGRDGALAWRAGNTWYRWTGAGGAYQASNVHVGKDPAAPPEADDLRDRQMRLFDTLREERARRDAAREQQEAW